MKNIIGITAFICYSLFLSSCGDNADEFPPGFTRDKSLAGSIAFSRYAIEVTGVYEGIELQSNPHTTGNILALFKLSDTEVSLLCHTEWEDHTFRISIPYLPVFGEPSDASFDYTSGEAMLTHNELEYNSVDVKVNGWITEVEPNTRNSPHRPKYKSNITIDCCPDGKKLSLLITYAQP